MLALENRVSHDVFPPPLRVTIRLLSLLPASSLFASAETSVCAGFELKLGEKILRGLLSLTEIDGCAWHQSVGCQKGERGEETALHDFVFFNFNRSELIQLF